MGIIREETTYADLDVVIEVVERQPGETTEPWRFVTLRVDDWGRMTPKELRGLGRWLQQQGIRLGREYKSNGAPKVTPNEPAKGPG